VKYIVAEYELPVEGLALRARFGETRVYENRLAMPRARILPQGSAGRPREPFRLAAVTDWSPNRVAVAAEGPGTLALAELAYPGWQVTVDGRPGEIQTLGGLLRSVHLEPGMHEVVFLYRPWRVYAGLSLFGLAALILACFLYVCWNSAIPLSSGRGEIPDVDR
jgi:hypothetical protein